MEEWQQPEDERGKTSLGWPGGAGGPTTAGVACSGGMPESSSMALLMYNSHFPPTSVLIQHFSLQKLSEG